MLAAATLSAALLVPVAVGAAEPASKMPGAMADALADAMVAGHNAVRAGVDADLPAMAWSQPAASAARTWAGTLKEEGCAMRHDPDLEDFGQNLFWAGAKRTVTTTRDARTGAVVDREVSYAVQDVDAETVVESWAGEARWYDLATDTCRAPEGKSCGHYTQIVWAETTGVGCAMGICADKSQIWVCNYAPPGNVVGERPY